MSAGRPRTENLDLGFEREAPEGTAAQTTVTVSWRPPLDGRRGLSNRAAEAGLTAAGHRLADRRLRLRAHLRELYARWSFAEERRDLFRDLSERTDRLAARARARTETGEDSGLSARRLELAAAEARSAMAAADVELLGIGAELRTLFPDLGATTRPEPPPLPAAIATLDANDRPDLKAGEVDVEHADLRRRLSGRYVQFPALVGGWTVLDEEGLEGVEGPVLGVEWSLPLFDRRQGERARAERELQVAEARLRLVRSRADAELRAAQEAYAYLREAAEEVVAATAETERVIEAATAEFEVGEATLTDLLETMRSATDSRLAALDLQLDALAAHRALELAVGRALTEGGSR